MLYEKYKMLPDSMDAAEVRQNFDDLFAAVATNEYDEDDVARAICELAYRQWYTYTLLDETTRKLVEDWIEEHWRIDCVEYLEMLSAITGHLGLRRTLEMFEHSLTSDTLSPEVRSEIEGTVSELKSTIDDPYSGMRQ